MINDEETRNKIVDHVVRVFPHDMGDVKVTSRRRQDRMKYTVELVMTQPQEFIEVKLSIEGNKDDKFNG